MIFYTETYIKSWQPNMIYLDLEYDLGHIYLSRNTYDQCILIADRFSYDLNNVESKLGLQKNQKEIVEYMSNVLPSPVNILVPFYNLIDKSVKLDIDNIKQLIGVLSYMSFSFDFNMCLKVPPEIRANLCFTKSILIEYQKHFEEFNFKIIDYSKNYTTIDKDNRSKKEDFIFEENIKEEDSFDVDEVLNEIGWFDVDIPSLKFGETVEKVVENSNEEIKEVVSVEDAYEKLINKYT